MDNHEYENGRKRSEMALAMVGVENNEGPVEQVAGLNHIHHL